MNRWSVCLYEDLYVSYNQFLVGIRNHIPVHHHVAVWISSTVVRLAYGSSRKLNTDKVLDVSIWLKVFTIPNETNGGFFA